MIRRLIVLACVLLVSSSCAVSIRRLVIMPRRCADGLPPLILVDVACLPDGICGYSCVPGRWRPVVGP